MSHRTRGLYRILERPAVYERFQKLLGAHRARARIVEDFARSTGRGCSTSDAGLLRCSTTSRPVSNTRVSISIRLTSRRRGGSTATWTFLLRSGRRGRRGGRRALVRFRGREVVAPSPRRRRGARVARFLGAAASARRGLAHQRPCLSRGAAARGAIPDFAGPRRKCAHPDAYRALTEWHFTVVESWLLTDMLPIPYDHFIMRARA